MQVGGGRTVRLEHPDLRDASICLAVKDLPSHGSTALGLIVADPGDDMGRLTLDVTK